MTEKTVLFVDDETMLIELYADTFKSFGYTTYEATNYHEGMELFRRHRPILVLVDLILNDQIGGVHCCKSIKDIQPLTIVVAVSGALGGSYTISNLRRQGLDHVLLKPVRKEAFEYLSLLAYRMRNRWDQIIKTGVDKIKYGTD